MFICIGIPRNTDDSLCSGTKRLLTFFLLLVFSTRGERDTIFTMLTVPSDPTTRGASRRPQTRLASPRSESQLASSSIRSQLTAFLKITKIPSPSLPGMTSTTPQVHFLSGVFIMTSVIVTSSTREREHLHSMCAPARALSRTVLSLTKPNYRI